MRKIRRHSDVTQIYDSFVSAVAYAGQKPLRAAAVVTTLTYGLIQWQGALETARQNNQALVYACLRDNGQRLEVTGASLRGIYDVYCGQRRNEILDYYAQQDSYKDFIARVTDIHFEIHQAEYLQPLAQALTAARK